MRRMGIFFFYDKDGIVGEYVSYYLQSIRPHLSHLIVVINGKINIEGRKKIEPFADEILIRENAGMDSWAYKYAMTYYGYENLKSFDELLLFNFTCYGGVYPFDPMFDEMAKRQCDCWGHAKYPERRGVVLSKMQKTNYIPEHIMSYFVLIRKKMFTDPSWKEYWDTLEMPFSHGDAVAVNELRFTPYFEDRGFALDSFVDRETTYMFPNNQINFAGAEMLLERYKTPLVKRKIFFIDYNHALFHGDGEEPRKALNYMCKNTDYDTNMIWDDLLRTQPISVLRRSLHLNEILSEDVLEKKRRQNNRIAALCFIFYEDLIDYCNERLSHLPVNADIYIWVLTEDMQEKTKNAFAELENNVYVLIKPDPRGREEAILLIEAKNIIAEYDLCLLVHAKKSSHMDVVHGRAFADHCWDGVLKNRIYVENVIALFEENARMGFLSSPVPVIGRGLIPIGSEWHTEKNKEIARQLLSEKFNINADLDPEPIHFGCCFWFRPQAFTTLLSHSWKYDDFPAEPALRDGTILHALERLYPVFAQYDGYYSVWAMSNKTASAYVDNLHFIYRDRELRNSPSKNENVPFSAHKGMLYQSVPNESKDALGAMLQFAYDMKTKNKKIVVWGAGQGGVRTFELLKHHGVKIKAFLDSSPGKIGTRIKKRLVFPPEILKADPSWNRSRCAVFIASIAHHEIAQRLEAARWRKGKNYYVVPQNILDSNFNQFS